MPTGVTHPATLPAPLYQGSANAWECDDGGHLNIRFHVERLSIGLMHFAHKLDMPRAFAEHATATLLPFDVHARFHKEARPPAPLAMHGAVIEISNDEAHLCCDMRHEDGAPAASFGVRVAHVDARAQRRFPWSARTRVAAAALTQALPDHIKPRSIDLTRAPCDASIARAIDLGATRIGASAVTPDQCDAFGWLRLEHFFGRVSDSAPNLLAPWRRASAKTGAYIAGAVAEARMAVRKFPRAGDLIELHSGIAEMSGKTLRIVHWICDPVSGDAWATFEVVALSFDTATRKAVTPSEEARAAMKPRMAAMTI